MKLFVDHTLSYWNGPTEFFGLLDGEYIYAVLDPEMDDPDADERRFLYWSVYGQSLRDALTREPDGAFTSSDVEMKV